MLYLSISIKKCKAIISRLFNGYDLSVLQQVVIFDRRRIGVGRRRIACLLRNQAQIWYTKQLWSNILPIGNARVTWRLLELKLSFWKVMLKWHISPIAVSDSGSRGGTSSWVIRGFFHTNHLHARRVDSKIGIRPHASGSISVLANSTHSIYWAFLVFHEWGQVGRIESPGGARNYDNLVIGLFVPQVSGDKPMMHSSGRFTPLQHDKKE